MTNRRELVWDSRLHQLAEYKRAHGDCTVPQSGSNLELGSWVRKQREAKAKNTIHADREGKLNAIGFVWERNCRGNSRVEDGRITWVTRLEQLEEYKKANGDCNVSSVDSKNFQLGRWVYIQRHKKKNCLLSQQCEAKLNSIGFAWRLRGTADWETRFKQLVEYKKAKGNCSVSIKKDSQHMELGTWVCTQRRKQKKLLLSEECEAKLNSIGFAWSTRCLVDWNLRFQQLLEYKEVCGDSNVPHSYCRNPQLGRWVHSQRKANKNKLTKERWEKLDSIGFDWGKQPYGSIARNQPLEDEHDREHGPLDTPERCSGNNPPRLHKLATARCLNNGQNEVLEKESVADFKTSDNDSCWDVHFQELLAYLQTHGDFNAPPCYPRNPLLARWVKEQRNDYDLKRRGGQTSLTPLREAKLDAIGFTWFVGSTEEDAPVECVYSASFRPEEVRSGNKLKSENNGVAVADRITSG
jgi:hypothetical protein